MKNTYKIAIILTLLSVFFLFSGCRENFQQTVSSKENSTYQRLNINNTIYSDNPENHTLKGMTICIDPGHGKLTRKVKKMEPIAPGSQIMKAAVASGTVGTVTKVTEESLNLSVSLKLKKALAEKGAKVVMVREDNVCNMTNVERTEFWNSSGADLTIRIHANGSDDKNISGILMMVPGSKYIKDKNMLEKSAIAGEYILEAVLEETKAKSMRVVKSNELTGFNWSKIPVVLLEMGFMTNPEEDKLLNTDEYQNKIVSGIVEGLENYYQYVISSLSSE